MSNGNPVIPPGMRLISNQAFSFFVAAAVIAPVAILGGVAAYYSAPLKYIVSGVPHVEFDVVDGTKGKMADRASLKVGGRPVNDDPNGDISQGWVFQFRYDDKKVDPVSCCYGVGKMHFCQPAPPSGVCP